MSYDRSIPDLGRTLTRLANPLAGSLPSDRKRGSRRPSTSLSFNDRNLGLDAGGHAGSNGGNESWALGVRIPIRLPGIGSSPRKGKSGRQRASSIQRILTWPAVQLRCVGRCPRRRFGTGTDRRRLAPTNRWSLFDASRNMYENLRFAAGIHCRSSLYVGKQGERRRAVAVALSLLMAIQASASMRTMPVLQAAVGSGPLQRLVGPLRRPTLR